jgi:hypothetical protein
MIFGKRPHISQRLNPAIFVDITKLLNILNTVHVKLTLPHPLGDVVAQWLIPLADTRLSRSSTRFDPGFPHSLLRGGRNHDCVIHINKIAGNEARRPFLSKKS